MHDVHVLDLATLTWKEVSEFPPSQPSASAAGPSAASEEAHPAPSRGSTGLAGVSTRPAGLPHPWGAASCLTFTRGAPHIHLLLLLRVAAGDAADRRQTRPAAAGGAQRCCAPHRAPDDFDLRRLHRLFVVEVSRHLGGSRHSQHEGQGAQAAWDPTQSSCVPPDGDVRQQVSAPLRRKSFVRLLTNVHQILVQLRSIRLITAHGAGASSLAGARTSPLPLTARTCSQCITPPPTRTNSTRFKSQVALRRCRCTLLHR